MHILNRIHSFIFIVLSVLTFFDLSAKDSCRAIWLRHSCGYTNGQQLLGGNAWGEVVAADKFGNSYNAGNFSGNWFTMDTVIEMNMNRYYINKYDRFGRRLWTSKIMGTTINSIITSNKMLCDDDGNMYICGIMSIDDSAYLSPNWYPIGGGFIAKYDSNGNNIWCKYVTRQSSSPIVFTDMSISGNTIYACGTMGYGTSIIDGISFISPKSQSGVIMSVSLDGQILQSEMLDTSTTTMIYGIEASKTSNAVYIIGEYLNGDVKKDGQTLTYTDNGTHSFIIAMNQTFDVQWMRKGITYIGMNGGVWGSDIKCLRSIELDSLDNIYAIGNGNGDSTVFGSLRFSHFIPKQYAQDVYLVKYDKTGKEQWLKHGGSGENDNAWDIITDKAGNSIIAVMGGFNTLYNFVFDNDSIQRYHGGLVSYDANGQLRYVKKLQEARSLRKLTWGIGSTFYGTGTGVIYKMPYDTLEIAQCEDTIHSSLANYKLVMVQFNDERSTILGLHETDQSSGIVSNHDGTIFIPFLQMRPLHAITLTDITGKQISLLESDIHQTQNGFLLNTNFLHSGIYFLKVIQHTSCPFIKMIVIQ